MMIQDRGRRRLLALEHLDRITRDTLAGAWKRDPVGGVGGRARAARASLMI